MKSEDSLSERWQKGVKSRLVSCWSKSKTTLSSRRRSKQAHKSGLMMLPSQRDDNVCVKRLSSRSPSDCLYVSPHQSEFSSRVRVINIVISRWKHLCLICLQTEVRRQPVRFPNPPNLRWVRELDVYPHQHCHHYIAGESTSAFFVSRRKWDDN